jgi:hypothetical protein
VIGGIKDFISQHRLSTQQRDDLNTISRGNTAVLEDLKVFLNKPKQLGSKSKNIGDRIIRGYEKLTLVQRSVNELRDRLILSIEIFSEFQKQVRWYALIRCSNLST